MQTLTLSNCLQKALSRQLQSPAGLRLQPARCAKCPPATKNLLVDFNTQSRDEDTPWANSWLPRKAWVLCVLGNLLWDPGLRRQMYFLKNAEYGNKIKPTNFPLTI